MFGFQLYPTPSDIARAMIDPYLDMIQAGAVILDPSAGKGNLLNECRWYGKADADNLFAIEIDPNLSAILKDNKYCLIGSDFLEYSGRHHIDLIVMNPPFADGASHLLKAWEIIRHGHIVCLLNEQTVLNPNSHEKEMLERIIEENGTVEYLYACFTEAERKTNVRVAMVRLQKVNPIAGFDFNLNTGSKKRMAESGVPDFENSVAKANYMQALVDSFDSACGVFQRFAAAKMELEVFLQPFSYSPYDKADDLIKRATEKIKYSGKDTRQIAVSTFNQFVQQLQKKAWNTVFEDTKMSAVVTDAKRHQFNEYMEEQGSVDFTIQNIESLYAMLFENRGQIMNDCLLEVFDEMTSYDAKNKIHWEGWKTNSAYKVNQRVIMPWFIKFDYWGFALNYGGRTNRLNDIDKVMCLLTGKKMPVYNQDNSQAITTMYNALDRKFTYMKGCNDYNTDKECESEFFRLQFFKKGTLHITFKEKSLWDAFNMAAAKGKNWIGDGPATKTKTPPTQKAGHRTEAQTALF